MSSNALEQAKRFQHDVAIIEALHAELAELEELKVQIESQPGLKVVKP